VLTRHPDPARHLDTLSHGFSGRLLRLYRLEQQFLARRDGRAIEPAYLLLSTTQGGFPRFGFWLDDERKALAGYVDLHRDSTLSGRLGAMDQIFPHELVHVILHQLAGDVPDEAGGANQVHAIGVRTDAPTAFGEGFAEHAQVMAVDDADAALATGALAADLQAAARADAWLAAYRRALEARWSLAPPARMGFVFWYSQAENALRYHGVKANRFARAPAIPERVLARRDRYPAYLLDNMLPGAPDEPLKPTARLLSTEGVVASLFWRWTSSADIRGRFREPAFYERFGVRPDDVTPVENAYLKLFAVIADRRVHDAAALLGGYADAFPDEAGFVEAVAGATGLEWPLPAVAEIWLANDEFLTGTTLWDQFRALPRTHTFDLNAASLVDLLAVDGMRRAAAEAILSRAPYETLAQMREVAGVSPSLFARFEAMAAGMARLRADTAGEDVESLGLMLIFRPYLYRAGVWIVVCAAAGALLYRAARRIWVPRLVINGVGAALVGLGVTWILTTGLQVGGGTDMSLLRQALASMLTSGGAAPFLPVVLFGLPGAVWQLAWYRSARRVGLVLLAWALACLPVLAVTQPLF